MTKSAADAMLSQLRSRGFARVSLQPEHRPWIRNALRSATSHDAATLGEFRFPPIEGPIVYTESRRLAFRALFEVGMHCFAGLLSSMQYDNDNGGLEGDGDNAARREFAEALREVRGDTKGEGSFRLFQRENEPFQPGQPFSQSFFNLFNYDHGSLNGHVDRSLLTVIYSTTIPDEQSTTDDDARRRSALWVKDTHGTWHDADRATSPDQAIVLVGEDLEGDGDNGASIASKLALHAAEHAVRVDPGGTRIERSHFRRDPGCAEGVRNRSSAAMILRHELG